MFVDLKKAKFKTLVNKNLFLEIYNIKKEKKEWKEKKEEELNKIASDYNVLELD
jgi:hypothetical protein